ncbi:phosphate signaling complex protein PhoU [Telmatospirillum sp.]|uniref:phosphate signaling complex protein PhoU n=1 Tax=Telmatospirillum sp. TaxID=2079197 RepID=UPI002840C08A|nr:phosphate signaling complex protein PhoU [Telmatospirillum sp.]MDR3440396.1 phosphate signaling complex protein PhoU [Telmatospirillum sp.]
MPHIVKSFDEELDRLRETLVRMGNLTRQQFGRALEALVQQDSLLAKQVGEGDGEIDQLEHAVNDQVVRVLALRAPLADDLRTVVASLKIASDFERIADYAANIARRSQLLNAHAQLPAIRTVRRMGTLVERQIEEVTAAQLERDAGKAVAVWNNDLAVDESYSSLFRELLTYMMEDPHTIGPASHLLFIAKNIERIGDHTTNISEMVYFVITGKYIEGDRPKSDSSSFPNV